ncbi:hypothetical protein MKL29_03495 [Streptococcus suis]|nr:hypothetical protein [Streptococcus suis]
MAVLSEETSRELKAEVLEAVKSYLDARSKVEQRALGLMTAKQIENELEIGRTTIQRWERAGLKRYQPPVDARKIFYKVDDILEFLGVDV